MNKEYFLFFIFFMIVILFYYTNIFLNKTEKFDNKNKNKCAIVIPIHPKHYEYGKNIIKSLENDDCDADLFFVFTNDEDKNNFEYFDKKTKSIILSDYLNKDQIKMVEKNGSWVSIKKLVALEILYEDYEYIICIDSEIIFLQNKNFYEMMENTYEQKKILGTLVSEEGIINIIKNSSITKNLGDNNKIKEKTNNYMIYTWWNNVPVYKSEDINDFFDFIGFDIDNLNDFLNKINALYFENLSYNYYCLVKNDFELVVDKNIKISLEHCDSKTIENINENKLKLFWVPNKAYKENNDYYKNNDFYIVYHMDIDRN
jgi:hypothetical protein